MAALKLDLYDRKVDLESSVHHQNVVVSERNSCSDIFWNWMGRIDHGMRALYPDQQVACGIE